MANTAHGSVSLSTGSVELESIERESFARVFSSGDAGSAPALYVVFGDLHGSIRAAQGVSLHVQTLFSRKATAIFQVGDFGYWPKGEASQHEDEFYKDSDALDFPSLIAPSVAPLSRGDGPLDALDAPFYFIRGNHEDLIELQSLPRDAPAQVANGFWFIPDGFVGEASGLRVFGLGGILRDTQRARGKRNKRQRKLAIQALEKDLRFSDSAQLVLPKTPVDMLLTHSGPESRESRHGSAKLDQVLGTGKVPLHFFGHHHRFSIDSPNTRGTEAVSIGLRNLASSRGRLLGGGVAVLLWSDAQNFEVLIHDPPTSSKASTDRSS